MQEIETKVLEIDKEELIRTFESLGAQKVSDTKLIAEWYQPKGFVREKENTVAWYLRIRGNEDGYTEVTWKGKSDVLGVSRKHKEINLKVEDREKIRDLFKEIGLEPCAYQEKFRTSWHYKDWQFDLDQYPDMPAYLEIEGNSEEHIRQAIKLLKLEEYQTSSEGERVLIQEKYNLNWYDMRFK
jgi:adenylate cyclase, class 2